MKNLMLILGLGFLCQACTTMDKLSQDLNGFVENKPGYRLVSEEEKNCAYGAIYGTLGMASYGFDGFQNICGDPDQKFRYPPEGPVQPQGMSNARWAEIRKVEHKKEIERKKLERKLKRELES